MKRRNRAQSSSLFLMELILAILFFSITSAVCVQFFVKSHLLSRDARILNSSVGECSNITEIIDSAEGLRESLELIGNEYPDAQISSDGAVLLYYDSDFAPCAEDEAAYTVTADLTEDDHILTSLVQARGLTDTAASAGDIIYELKTQHSIARRAGHEER